MLTNEYQRWVTYCRRAVQRAAVPPMFEDDAIHDVIIKAWRADDFGPIVMERAVIDAARRYGHRTRRGIERDTQPLPDYEDSRLSLNPWPAVDRRLEFGEAWRKLNAKQRGDLIAEITGRGRGGSAGTSRRYQVRQMLRRSMAA